MWPAHCAVHISTRRLSIAGSHIHAENAATAESLSLLFAFIIREGQLAAHYGMRRWGVDHLSDGSHVRPGHGSCSHPDCRLSPLVRRPDAATITRGRVIPNAVWSRHIANMIRLNRRAKATIAIRRPRRAASCSTHARNVALP